jgi:hypothetical protein
MWDVLTPIRGDPVLGLLRSHRTRADLLMKPVLHLVLGVGAVFASVGLRPEIPFRLAVASDSKRDQVIFLIVLSLCVRVLILGDLLNLESVGV